MGATYQIGWLTFAVFGHSGNARRRQLLPCEFEMESTMNNEFDAVIPDDSVLPHPQSLNLAERMERAVYLGLDEKNITAKFVAGKKIGT